jgi:plastocyanin
MLNPARMPKPSDTIGFMKKNRPAALPLIIAAATALAIPFVGSASAAKPVPPKSVTVSIGGDTNDGFYFPSSVHIKAKRDKVTWSWQEDSGPHNVYLDTTKSTKGLKVGTDFPKLKSTLQRYSGDPAVTWPSGGWKPTKPGIYILYCTKHSVSMRMKVVVDK